MEFTTPMRVRTELPPYAPAVKAWGCIPKQPDSWKGDDAVCSSQRPLVGKRRML